MCVALQERGRARCLGLDTLERIGAACVGQNAPRAESAPPTEGDQRRQPRHQKTWVQRSHRQEKMTVLVNGS